MLGEKVGPYRLLAELGRGGMGVVFRASVEDGAGASPGGPFVAVKVIHPHLAGHKEHAERFLREAEIGRRIVHENLVRTLDAGASILDGQEVRWLALELVEGRSLRDLRGDGGRLPEALLREIGIQAARALAAIHAGGVVHRDVKPENILVTPDHRVRLMDLGIARLLEASASLTRTGSFAGSILYAAPEQLQDAAATPASDLYALGLTLYELATGAHPSGDGTPAAIVDARLHRTPIRADVVDRAVSPFLAEVLAVLLEKEPARRFRSAEALAEVLRAGEEGAWWRERAASARAATPVRVPVRREAPLTGRDAELATLRTALDDARAGAGRVVLLEGEAGIGKTRLVDAFLAGLSREAVQAAYVAFGPDGGVEVLRELWAGLLPLDTTAESLRQDHGLNDAQAAGVAAFVRGDVAAAAASLPSDGALAAALARILEGLGRERPVALVLDDLHLASARGRALVAGVARAVGRARVVLVLSARSGGIGGDVEALERGLALRRVPLSRLGAPAVRGLLRALLRSTALADRLVGEVSTKSDGVPLFVLEIARQLESGGAIRTRADGTVSGLDLTNGIRVPGAVRDLVLGRLTDLRREERDLLDVASVQGDRFDPDLCARALERRRVHVLQELAEIERRTGLVRSDGRLFRFDHRQVQDTLAAELAAPLAEEYHALLSDAVAAREGARADQADALAPDAACRLVHHALHGSRPEAARPWLGRALEHLYAQFRAAEGVRLARRALEVDGLLAGKDRLDALLRLAAFLELTGPRDAMDPTFQEAISIADALGTPAPCVRARAAYGWSLWSRGRFAEARDVLAPALEAARASGDPHLEIPIARNLGLIATSLARPEEAAAHHLRALDLARAAKDVRQEAAALGNLGMVADNLGRRAEARQRYETCREISERVGARRLALAALGNLATLDVVEGQYAVAHRRLLAHLEGAREIGDLSSEAYALVNLGLVLLLQGALDESKEALEGAILRCAETGQRRVESYARERLGILAFESGDPARAETEHRSALEMRREMGYPTGEVGSLVELARLARRRGDVGRAAALADEARALAERHRVTAGVVAAAVERSALPGGDPEAALELFERHEAVLDADDRLRALVTLAAVTDRDDLVLRARQDAERLRSQALPAYRERMDRLECHRLVG